MIFKNLMLSTSPDLTAGETDEKQSIPLWCRRAGQSDVSLHICWACLFPTSCHVMRVRKLDDTIGQFIAHQAAKSCSTRFADTFLMFLCIPMRGVVDLSQSVKEFLLLCGIFSFSIHAVESYSTWKSSICLAHVVNFFSRQMDGKRDPLFIKHAL